jgi:hypothetical protein
VVRFPGTMLRPPTNARVVRHGDKVWTPGRTPGVERHYGIFDEELRKFLHNTHPGGVQYATPEEFINGQFWIEKSPEPGYEHMIVERARELIGTPYHLIKFNCEHYVNVVFEGKLESPQLQRATLGAVLTGAAVWLLSRVNAPVYNASSGRYHDRRSGRFVAR